MRLLLLHRVWGFVGFFPVVLAQFKKLPKGAKTDDAKESAQRYRSWARSAYFNYEI
jgi:hypothetical protein